MEFIRNITSMFIDAIRDKISIVLKNKLFENEYSCLKISKVNIKGMNPYLSRIVSADVSVTLIFLSSSNDQRGPQVNIGIFKGNPIT